MTLNNTEDSSSSWIKQYLLGRRDCETKSKLSIKNIGVIKDCLKICPLVCILYVR